MKSIYIKIGGFKSSDQFWNQAAGGNGTASGEGGKVNRAPAKRSSHSDPEPGDDEHTGDFLPLRTFGASFFQS